MKRHILVVLSVFAISCAVASPVPSSSEILFRTTGAAAWRVVRGRARDTTLAARQITDAADGIRVTMNASESDLKPWSWGSLNAKRKIPLDDAEDGSILELRFRCSNPPIVSGDVSIGIEDAGGSPVLWSRLPVKREGDIQVVSFGLADHGRAAVKKPKPPFALKYINFGMECESGWITFISLRVMPPPTETVAETLSLDVETGNPLHVVRTNLAERAVLVFSNRCGRAGKWTGTLTVKNGNGCTIENNLSFALKANATHRVALPNPLPEMGVWCVSAELTCDDGTVAACSTRFAQIDHHAVTPKLQYGKFRFGVVYHITNYGTEDRAVTLDALTAMGAKIARVGGLWYYHYEYVKGCADWSVADGIVNDLERRGIAICGGCYANPPWAMRADGSKASGFGAAAPGFQGAFMEKLAQRFGERIDYYEIGNEWDLKSAADMTIDEAVRVTRECAEAIRRGCPSARVIPCGWAVESSEHPMVRQKGFQERVMKECQDVLDAHPIHVHGPWAMHATRMNEFFAMRKKEGILLPWFANETAVTSVYGREQSAAETLWRKIVWSWAHGSTDYCWYNLRATPGDENNAEQGYGLLTRDYHPRAGFAAFSALSALLAGHDFKEMAEDKSGRAAYAFRGMRGDTEEQVFVAWDRLGGEGFPLRLRIVRDEARPLQVATVDMYGNRAEMESRGDEAVWHVEARPCALIVRGAVRCDVLKECLAAAGSARRRVRCGKGEPSHRAAELTLDDYAQVTEIFQANPELLHRLWKGVNDVSAAVWFSLKDDAVIVDVAVTDDTDAQYDAAFVRIGKDEPLRMKRVSRQGVVTSYTMRFGPGKLPDMVSVTVDDDDGEGTEVRISESVNVLK